MYLEIKKRIAPSIFFLGQFILLCDIMKIWFDVVTPAQALFFNSIVREFDGKDVFITLRDRAETIELARVLGLNGIPIGRDYSVGYKKTLGMIYRTLALLKIPYFDWSMSFGNPMTVVVSKIRRKGSLLFSDNDYKLLQKHSMVQIAERFLKSKADIIIVPRVCYETFERIMGKERIIPFDGYKEDVYIADYTIDHDFINKVPYSNFIVLRPEALSAIYVREKYSIVPDLLKLFYRENINVVYLPRESYDYIYARGYDNVFIPNNALNGLDLCFYSNVVLTGSGTMAREAALLGKTAISFFPERRLLAVDQRLVDDGKIFHSRIPEEILDYVLSRINNKKDLTLIHSKKVKKKVIEIIKNIIEDAKGNQRIST